MTATPLGPNEDADSFRQRPASREGPSLMLLLFFSTQLSPLLAVTLQRSYARASCVVAARQWETVIPKCPGCQPFCEGAAPSA